MFFITTGSSCHSRRRSPHARNVGWSSERPRELILVTLASGLNVPEKIVQHPDRTASSAKRGLSSLIGFGTFLTDKNATIRPNTNGNLIDRQGREATTCRRWMQPVGFWAGSGTRGAPSLDRHIVATKPSRGRAPFPRCFVYGVESGVMHQCAKEGRPEGVFCHCKRTLSKNADSFDNSLCFFVQHALSWVLFTTWPTVTAALPRTLLCYLAGVVARIKRSILNGPSRTVYPIIKFFPSREQQRG